MTRTLVVCALALVTAACGTHEQHYASFVAHPGHAGTWNVWGDGDARHVFVCCASYPYSCGSLVRTACGPPNMYAYEIDGRVVVSCYSGRRRFASDAAAWRSLEYDGLFTRRQLRQVLRGAPTRAKPSWVRRAERCRHGS